MDIVIEKPSREGECLEREREFSPLYRWQHWIRVVAVIVLTITGFYLAVPIITPVPNAEPTNFMYALFRSWHIIFGFVLLSVIILKSYLFLFGRDYSHERGALKDVFNIKVVIQQIGVDYTFHLTLDACI